MPIDDKTAASMLKAIGLSGSPNIDEVHTIISTNPIHILNHSSGLPRIKNPEKFSLILSQPDSLQGLNQFEIRCCMCRQVIGYPCWHYEVKYAINNFHFFICFDAASPTVVNCKCLRG
jgi:hypothetical protein